jgi:DDE superfamily endonuclease
MLPACRTDGDVFAIPKFALDPSDVQGFLDELRGFHHAFRECFARSEPREHFFHYMVGQFSELDRKSIEPMARQVEGGNVRAMQRCISDAVWDDVQMLRTYHRWVCVGGQAALHAGAVVYRRLRAPPHPVPGAR